MSLRAAPVLLRNSSSAFLLTVTQTGARFLGAMLVARYLGSEGFGLFALVWAYLELFRVASDFGLETVLIRRTALDPSAWPDLRRSALVLKLALASLAGLAAVGVAGVAGFSPSFRGLVLLASPSLILAAVTSILTVPHFASLSLHRIAWVGAVAGGLYLVAVMTAGALGLGIGAFVLCLVMYEGVTLLGVLAANASRGEGVAPVRARLMRGLLREAAAPALNAILVTAYIRMGLLLVGAWTDLRTAGHLALAARLADGFKLISGAVATSTFPMFARLAHEGRGGELRRLFWAWGAALVGGMLIVALLAPPALRLLLPLLFPRYEGLDVFLTPLLWAMVFVFVNMHASSLLSGLGLFWMTTAAATLNLAVNLIANAALIPRVGGVGAVWAYLITEGVNTTTQLPAAALLASRRFTARAARPWGAK